MKLFTLVSLIVLVSGCSTDSSKIDISDIPNNEHFTVCGEIDGEKQSYPTIGDLKSDGATFVSYGPCYE